MKKLLYSLFIFLFFFQSILVVDAQISSAQYEVDSKEDAHCELNNRYIDSLVIEAVKNKPNEIIFVISRLASREKLSVGNSRLGNAELVLTGIKKVDGKRIVFASGKRLPNGKGRLEFYVGSNLFLVSLADRNKQICLLCCP